MNKKCIIFGVNSYIGKHIHKHLILNSFECNVYSFSDTKYDKLDIINEIQKLDSIDWNVDFVFIMSGLTGTKVSFENAKNYIELNEIGLVNILNSIKNSNYKPRIIYPSSRLVYKGKNGPISENDDLEFKTIYSLTKIQAENILKLYQRTFDIPYTIFRICVSYGNEIDSVFSYGTIGFFVKQAINNKKITIYGDGELTRSYTHIHDIVNQIIEAILKSESLNNVYNIKGENFSLNQVAEEISKKYNALIEHIPWPEFEKEIESGDTFFDSTKINNLLNNYFLKHRFKEWTLTI